MKELKLSIWGVDIRISFWFLAVITLYSIAFDKALAVLLSVLLHELSHVIFICLFGAKLQNISLRISDINLKSDLKYLSKTQRVIICLAGPLANMAAALSGLYFGNRDFFAVNLVIAAFQLLPVSGSDGGEFIRLISGSNSKFPKVISLILSALITATGLALLMNYRYNYSLLIAGLYLIFMTCKSGL